MRTVVLVTLTLCFLIACHNESLAFWWNWKKKTEQVPAPEMKEAQRPVEQQKMTEEEAAEIAKAEEAKRLAEEQKRAEEEAARKEQARQKIRELKKNRAEELNNTEWEIELSLLDSQGKAPDRDIITFKDNQISSANLNRSGFAPTNYTLTINEDGTVTCETMQSSGKGGIAFWRAEFDANIEKMRGILSHRIDEKTSKDYSFRSITKRVIEPSSGE